LVRFEAPKPKPRPQHGEPPIEVVIPATTSRDGRAGGAPLTPRRARAHLELERRNGKWAKGKRALQLALALALSTRHSAFSTQDIARSSWYLLFHGGASQECV
jgi:hypothetical protein